MLVPFNSYSACLCESGFEAVCKKVKERFDADLNEKFIKLDPDGDGYFNNADIAKNNIKLIQATINDVDMDGKYNKDEFSFAMGIQSVTCRNSEVFKKFSK